MDADGAFLIERPATPLPRWCYLAGRLCATGAESSGVAAVVDVTQGPDEFEDPITITRRQYRPPIAAIRYSNSQDRLTLATADGETELYFVEDLKVPLSAIAAKRSMWVRIFAIDATGSNAVLASSDGVLAVWDPI